MPVGLVPTIGILVLSYSFGLADGAVDSRALITSELDRTFLIVSFLTPALMNPLEILSSADIPGFVEDRNPPAITPIFPGIEGVAAVAAAVPRASFTEKPSFEMADFRDGIIDLISAF